MIVTVITILTRTTTMIMMMRAMVVAIIMALMMTATILTPMMISVIKVKSAYPYFDCESSSFSVSTIFLSYWFSSSCSILYSSNSFLFLLSKMDKQSVTLYHEYFSFKQTTQYSWLVYRSSTLRTLTFPMFRRSSFFYKR